MIQEANKRKRTEIGLRQMSEKERKTYYRNKTREYRFKKLTQKCLLKRGFGRYLIENKLFTKDDLAYIKSIQIKEKKESIYEKIKRLRLKQGIDLFKKRVY